MFQKTFSLTDNSLLPDALSALRDHIPDVHRAFLLVTTDDYDVDNLQSLISQLDSTLPGLTICGLTVNGHDIDHGIATSALNPG